MVHFPSEKLRCSSSTSLLFSEPFLIENSSFSSSIIPSLGVADEGGGEAKGKGMQPSDDLQQQVARRPHCLLFFQFSPFRFLFFGYKGVINIKRRKRSRIEKPPPQTIFFQGNKNSFFLFSIYFVPKIIYFLGGTSPKSEMFQILPVHSFRRFIHRSRFLLRGMITGWFFSLCCVYSF